MFKLTHSVEDMAEAIDGTVNSDNSDQIAAADVAAQVGGLIAGTVTAYAIAYTQLLVLDDTDEGYSDEYARGYVKAWENMYRRLKL